MPLAALREILAAGHLKPVVQLSETPPFWSRPPVPLGTHPPAWPERGN
jgi:hypothetical protein